MIRYLLIGSAVLGLLSAVQTYRIDRLKQELAVASRYLGEVKAALEAAETVAQNDVNTVLEDCEVRVAEARRSARRIETIIERPYAVDSGGCAVRDLVPSSELRQALQPDAPTP